MTLSLPGIIALIDPDSIPGRSGSRRSESKFNLIFKCIRLSFTAVFIVQIQDPEVSIAIRCVNDSVIQLRECIEAILRQVDVRAEIWIIDSSDHDEFESICAEHELVHYVRIPGKTLSQGRNRGIELARADYILFTDPDCIPCSTWLRHLKSALDTGAAIVGGKIVPRWLVKPPWYIRNSHIARTHLSLLDYGDEVRETDRVFGANFGLSKTALGNEARFREDLGRSEGLLLGGEETELCRRVRRFGGKVVYTPDGYVEHQIPKNRVALGWNAKRMFYGGMSRTFLGGLPNPLSSPRCSLSDLLYIAAFAGPYIAGQLYGFYERRRGPNQNR